MHKMTIDEAIRILERFTDKDNDASDVLNFLIQKIDQCNVQTGVLISKKGKKTICFSTICTCELGHLKIRDNIRIVARNRVDKSSKRRKR